MTTSLPDALPVLAVGSHERGSGKACIMNAISYLNGDTVITDMPECADPVLAAMAQRVNDTICTHRQYPFVPDAVAPTPPDGNLLCPECSHLMWMLGVRLIDTAEYKSTPADEATWRAWIRVVCAALTHRVERTSPGGASTVLWQGLQAFQTYAYHGTTYGPPSGLRLSSGERAVTPCTYGEPWLRWRQVVDAERVALSRTALMAPSKEGVHADESWSTRGVLMALQFAWSMAGIAHEWGERMSSLANDFMLTTQRLAKWLGEHLDSALTFSLDGLHGKELAATYGAMLDAWDREFRPGATPYALSPQRADALHGEIHGAVPAGAAAE